MNLKENISIIYEYDMDILEEIVKPNTKYNLDALNGFFKKNVLLTTEDTIEFNFKFGASHFEYRNSISAYTFIDTLQGCVNNEFAEDIKNDTASISINKDFSNPDNLYCSVNITLADTNLDDFIGRIIFLSIVFNISIEKLNEMVKESALNARVLYFADAL